MLILSSAAIVTCSLAAMGTFFYLQKEWGAALASESLGWLPLTSLIVFFISFSCGYATVPFILMGELFPSRYRSTLSAISSSFNGFCAYTVVRCFPDMQIAMGKHGAFWFFMVCTLVGILFIYFFLPETKGKTLEDIEQIFNKDARKVGPVVNTPFSPAEITTDREQQEVANSVTDLSASTAEK